LKRYCPYCSRKSVPVSELILSDAYCRQCCSEVGVHGVFRLFFGLLTLIACVIIGVSVYAIQGLYAMLLIVSLPIGAIGIIKARFSPLVVRTRRWEWRRMGRQESANRLP